MIDGHDSRGAAIKGSAIASDTLARLLRGDWRDPDGGAPIKVPLIEVAIERSLVGAEAELVAPLHLGRRIAVVSDTTTRDVLGARIESALSGVGVTLPVVLGAQPHADVATVEALRRETAAADALVAVGSGTLNDLCKYAAAKDGKPYAVFATAPSMNGYASTNAAITVDGHKQTLPAKPPVGVFVDLAVLSKAPPRMIRSGIGDSLCRSTAQADWLLSHHLLGTPFRVAPFALLADDEPLWMNEPEALLQGDLDAMRALARTLVLSGLGMTICGGSYPASQGEHLISHYIDMFAPSSRGIYFHGEQVAVATLTMARIQRRVLGTALPRLKTRAMTFIELQTRFGAEIGAACWREFEAKRSAQNAKADFDARISDGWTDTVDDVRRVWIPPERIRDVLNRAGCPTTPTEIGLSADFYADAVRNARYIRNRYTFLDLADDSGMLDFLLES